MDGSRADGAGSGLRVFSSLCLSRGPAPASRKKGEPGRDLVFAQTMTLPDLPCKH